ncbi:MAG TPA: APC family permease [Candidatus Acidoferrales bacterium]
MSSPGNPPAGKPAQLRRVLGLFDLIIIGIVIIQPIAPMGIYGVISNDARGHVVTTILIAMVAMLFTAVSYGKMARAYPSAGSAYTYVGQELNPVLGYITGWAIVMDYLLNPLICTIICSQLTQNILPFLPYWALVFFYAGAFTVLNSRGIQTSARINEVMAAGMSIVVVIFFVFVVRFLWNYHQFGPGFFTHPFYNPATFSFKSVFHGTSVAVLTYIGFDAISTFSEEVENPRRNIMLATVLVCLITGVLASLEVYAAQLVWRDQPFPADKITSAFPLVAQTAGGYFLFQLINFTILIANIGSGMGSQLGAARLLYGMGRSDGIPKKFFGAIDPVSRVPRNNVIFVGVVALIGAFLITYDQGADLLNFGALLAFMGVNIAALVRYYLRAQEKNILNLISPLLGFLICAFIWTQLSGPALKLGAVWMAVGITYGAVKTKGFQAELVNFDIPQDET